MLLFCRWGWTQNQEGIHLTADNGGSVPAEVGFLNQFLLYKITKYLQSWPLLIIKKEHKSTLQEILINNLIHHSSRIHIDMKYVTRTHEEEWPSHLCSCFFQNWQLFIDIYFLIDVLDRITPFFIKSTLNYIALIYIYLERIDIFLLYVSTKNV